MGFHLYECSDCCHTKKVFHTCKSRFCSSCGKKATEQWIENNLNALPNVPWQHITFTLPQEFRELFWMNRELTNHLVKIPADIITKIGKRKHLVPGIFIAIHTFGRDLKKNVHFHVSNTYGGISLDGQKWIPTFYIHHQILKDWWRQEVVKVIRRLYKTGKIKLPPEQQKICSSYASFNSWLNVLYNKSWVVHLQKVCTNHQRNIKYLGRYLKRPPMAETRIIDYDGTHVTYRFLDHHDKSMASVRLSIEEFIKRLIQHIPDLHFRLIRYYNWLANRTRGKLLPLVFKLIKQTPQISKKIMWRDLFDKSFGFDPLLCKACNLIMKLTKVVLPNNNQLLNPHKTLAHISL